MMTNANETSFPRPLTTDEARLRRRRSIAIGLTLGGLAALFFAVSFLKVGLQMAHNVS